MTETIIGGTVISFPLTSRRESWTKGDDTCGVKPMWFWGLTGYTVTEIAKRGYELYHNGYDYIGTYRDLPSAQYGAARHRLRRAEG